MPASGWMNLVKCFTHDTTWIWLSTMLCPSCYDFHSQQSFQNASGCDISEYGPFSIHKSRVPNHNSPCHIYWRKDWCTCVYVYSKQWVEIHHNIPLCRYSNTIRSILERLKGLSVEKTHLFRYFLLWNPRAPLFCSWVSYSRLTSSIRSGEQLQGISFSTTRIGIHSCITWITWNYMDYNVNWVMLHVSCAVEMNICYWGFLHFTDDGYVVLAAAHPLIRFPNWSTHLKYLFLKVTLPIFRLT